jgi:hypothetical protein
MVAACYDVPGEASELLGGVCVTMGCMACHEQYIKGSGEDHGSDKRI